MSNRNHAIQKPFPCISPRRSLLFCNSHMKPYLTSEFRIGSGFEWICWVVVAKLCLQISVTKQALQDYFLHRQRPLRQTMHSSRHSAKTLEWQYSESALEQEQNNDEREKGKSKNGLSVPLKSSASAGFINSLRKVLVKVELWDQIWGIVQIISSHPRGAMVFQKFLRFFFFPP